MSMSDSLADTLEPSVAPSLSKQVLLVDDNPTNLQVLYQALEAQGYELLIALGGEEALGIAQQAMPTLILLDINMPGMDGFETCRRLKANPQTRDIVVIFLSARDALEDKIEGLKLGAVDYVSKPFQFEEVVARVKTQFELRRAQIELQRMHEKADSLLLNILPRSIAERLKENERNIVDAIPEATILFCDLVGFTPLAARLEPSEVVALLNGIFTKLDQLGERRGLEKIKTIGDAYMLAGGVPDPMPNHARAVAEFALDAIALIPEVAAAAGVPIDVRIGIHSGPVIAGVIGENKFAYDLWGDTVNTASRMESSSEKGRIHISEQSKRLMGEGFLFESRGHIQIKGKGDMETFFLLGRK